MKLTVLTPTFRRPIGLKMCMATVAAQHRCEEIQHLIVRDYEGKGIAGVYRDLPSVNDQITGDWVYVLSDDDLMLYPRVLDLIEHVEATFPATGCIMVKMLCAGRILPWEECWEAAPKMGGVTLGNWIVRRDVHCQFPYGQRYEGDFDHFASVYSAQTVVTWVDLILSASQRGASFGRPE